MRILHLIYDDLGNPWLDGGGAVRTLEINRRLAARGHQVIVGCGAYPGAPASDIRGGVLYLRIGGPGGPPRGYLASRLRYAWGARALLKQVGYDIVVEDFSPYSPVLTPWRARRGAAVAASVQNLSGAHAIGKYGWGPRGLGPRVLERPLLRQFRYVLTVSPGIADEMRPWWHPGGPGHLTVIPNSTGHDLGDTASRSPTAEEPVILFLGRLDPYQKGLDTLLRAYAAAAPRMPGVRLEIAGGGAAEAVHQLRAWAAESGLAVHEGDARRGAGPQVVLRGKLDGARATAALRRCLFLALPSRYEAWPIVAIEAATCGRPVLGTDVVGVRDAAPATAHGWLVPPADPAALAAGMVRLAGDPALRQRLGEQGRAWAAQFTWDALAARQEQFYQAVLAEARAAATPRGGRQERDSRPA
ncbi:MAG TPA: glycosyltransferase family 4 protein [Chloroflexia bacterium]|nr:glycosyltransferase family 4 protein [Chloroflexia bacterium]